ncbi:TonB-dependent receptor domain-containing protein [Pseudoalteromonas aurantia]|uniref:Hemin receptor n=1 Tax=Pseudoalteromonas aurantia TaxID=43654 RepID=A0A5S3UXW6_9GAMM|nr:TonB-dependent receptor [Pseudoalteromonas aurantia]TMO62553.1 hemin receptor [Pseudoalteromonas aurantia]TMO72413.1 hemin receptor [Pseudoalteromonas aurantia]
MRLSKISLCLATLSLPLLAQANPQSADNKSVMATSLDAVTVTATRTKKTVLQSAQAVNVVSSEQIEKQLESNLFNVLDMIPNVSANGGPRNSGQKFNIRGFSDAEDVLVTVDGMVQTFEKYRMGSLFTDPELYRTVSIKRGTSTVLHGGGALGGVVQLELKDAADFLRDGETAGAKVKLGFDSNNDQQNGSVFAFARPIEELDLLAAVVKRDSDDFELSNGEMLDNSGIENSSLLLKAEYFLTDDSLLGATFNTTQDDQRTEFNTTDPGAWGTVYREVEQTVANLSYELTPSDNQYIDLTLKLGFTSSQVTESDGVGMLKDFIGIKSNYEYNITTFDAMNTSKLGEHTVTYGVQYTDKERVGEKTALPCERVNYETYACEQYGTVAVTGEMTSQPGGDQARTGLYIQDEFKLQGLTIIAGVRYEHYETTPTAEFASQFSALNSKVTHSDWAPSISLNYQISPEFAVFANRQSGFRAPLLDELYDQYGGRQPALDLDIEYSDNSEIGFVYSADNVLSDTDSLNVRMMYFAINVDDEITSLTSESQNPMPNARYANRASNDRDGVELELEYANQHMYSNLTYSTIDGEDNTGKELWYLPADKLSLDAGISLLGNTVMVGAKVVHTSDREVESYNRRTREYSLQDHQSHTLWDIYASWDVTTDVNLRLAIDNVFEKEYTVIAGTGGGIGDYGVGRNIKTQVSWRF